MPVRVVEEGRAVEALALSCLADTVACVSWQCSPRECVVSLRLLLMYATSHQCEKIIKTTHMKFNINLLMAV